MNSTPAATHTAALNKTHATARKHTLTHSTTTTPAAQNQHRTLDSNQDRSSGLGAGLSASPSLGLGPGLSSGFGLGSSRGPSRGILDGVSSEFSLGQETKKRKEMAQEETVDPDLDLSLEELESLMSDDMDIPPEPTANKKQRLDQEEQSSASWKQTTKKDNGNASWQKSSEALKENTKNQKSERGKGSPANQKVSLECDKTVSANQKQKVEPKEGVKEEEVSFVVTVLYSHCLARVG